MHELTNMYRMGGMVLNMKKVRAMKQLLTFQIVMLLSVFSISNVFAGDTAGNKYTDSNTSRAESDPEVKVAVENKVVAYIYGETAEQLKNSLLEAQFASNYFGLAITAVQERDRLKSLSQDGGFSFLLEFTLGKDQDLSKAVEALKGNPIVEFVQKRRLISDEGEFTDTDVLVNLDDILIGAYADSLLDPQFVTTLWGINIDEVRAITSNVYVIKLKEGNRQAVLDATAILIEQPYINNAQPNYIYRLA